MTLKTLLVSAAVLGGLGAASFAGAPAQAKGCLKGALVGGVAGHYAGHHGVLGAVGGCITGRALAKKKLQQQNAPAANPVQTQPNQPAL